MRIARATHYFAAKFIRKNWLWIVLLFLALLMLPKLLNAYSLVLHNLGEWWDRLAKWIKLPETAARNVRAGIQRTAKFVADNPLSTWGVTALVATVSPAAAGVLTLWGISDLCKGDETLTLTVRGSATGIAAGTAQAPAPAAPDPVADFYRPPAL